MDTKTRSKLPEHDDVAEDGDASRSAPAARWKKARDPELERLYVEYERIADAFIGRMDHKMVQRMEEERIVGEGSVESMQAIVDKYRGLLK